MTIQLITGDQFKFLVSAYTEHPTLTLQNTGYQYIPNSRLSADDLAIKGEIETLVKQGALPSDASKMALYRYCRENGIILRTDKQEKCPKREVISWGQ
jgi:hypothetical protein